MGLASETARPPMLGMRPGDPFVNVTDLSASRRLQIVVLGEETHLAPVSVTALIDRGAAGGRTSEPARPSSTTTRTAALDMQPSEPLSPADASDLHVLSADADVSAARRLQIGEETRSAPVSFSLQNDQVASWVAIENGSADDSVPNKAATREARPEADVSPRGPQAVATVSKLLNLRVDEPSVGAVSIRMRLAGTSLGLEVEAERSDTADLLAEGRGDLIENLRSAGYATETLVIKRATRRGRSPADGAGPGNGRCAGVPVSGVEE